MIRNPATCGKNYSKRRIAYRLIHKGDTGQSQRHNALLMVARESDPSATAPAGDRDVKALEQRCLAQTDDPDYRRIMIDQAEVGRQISSSLESGAITRSQGYELFNEASAPFADAATLNQQLYGITPMAFVANADEDRSFARMEHGRLESVMTNEVSWPGEAKREALPSSTPTDANGRPVLH